MPYHVLWLVYKLSTTHNWILCLRIVLHHNHDWTKSQNKLLFTMDITSLYTVILNDKGLRTLKHFFDKRTVKEPSSETLLCQAEPVLSLSRFSFGVTYYKQINDVAMGTNMRPSQSFCWVYRTPILHSLQQPQTWTLRLLHWRLHRYYLLYQRRAYLNYNRRQFLSPGSKIYLGISDISLAFLDVKISLEDNGLCPNVYYKPTDSHSYLLYSSSHPSHVKNSVPFSQFLRLRR